MQQSTSELYNITASTGFMVDVGNGRTVYTPLSDIYNSYLDDAITGMANGAYDYNTLIRKTTGMMTRSGLRSDYAFSDTGTDTGVQYASGWHNRIDVAVRRALLTGFSQLAGRVTDMNAQKLGTNYFEVSAHAGARPSHVPWQGRVFTKQQLVEICGLGSGGGLEGWNCHHTKYPFIPGVSERNYTDEQLEEMARKEAETTTYKGKEYTPYQATQKQRQLETALRAQRERVQLLKEGGADPDDVTIAKCKYQALLDEYHSFSKKMGLQEQRDRIYTGRTAGRIAPGKSTYTKWAAEQEAKAEARAAAKAEAARRADMNANEKEQSLRTDAGKEFGVNWSVVKSKAYTERLGTISSSPKVLSQVSSDVRQILVANDGKNTEELFAVDMTKGTNISSVRGQNVAFGVIRTEKFQADLDRADAMGHEILLIHNHPRGYAPSVDDINALLKNVNAAGLTAGHDGSLYYYTKPDKEITEFDVRVASRKISRYNYDDTTAMEEILQELQKTCGFECRKL